MVIFCFFNKKKIKSNLNLIFNSLLKRPSYTLILFSSFDFSSEFFNNNELYLSISVINKEKKFLSKEYSSNISQKFLPNLSSDFNLSSKIKYCKISFVDLIDVYVFEHMFFNKNI